MPATDRPNTPSEPGAPQPGRIPLSVPYLGGNESAYLEDCVRTNWVSSAGPYVDRLERLLAAETQAQSAVSMVSGTAALHIALLLAGVGRGDVVLVPSLTFIAPANAVAYTGARPVFVDVEPDWLQMDVDVVRAYLERCRVRGEDLQDPDGHGRVRAILPVDLLGHPADMDPLRELARSHGLVVVEDASESLGARYRGRPVGNLGDVGCFSFNGNKIVTSGGGGMLVTDDAAWAERARYLSTQAKDDPVEYVHGTVGYNYRLTNVQAALGCAQVERLEAHVAEKRRIAAAYRRAFEKDGRVTPMAAAEWAEPTYWLYTVRLPEGVDRRTVMRALEEGGIQTRPLWEPLHRSAAFADTQGSCPVADEARRVSLSLPCSVGLPEADQERVVATLLAALDAHGPAA